MPSPGPIVEIADWPAYQLVDSGEGRKLERFGDRLLIRGEPKAWWRRRDPLKWREADAENDDAGKWHHRAGVERTWQMRHGRVTAEVRLTDMSKHVGVFPEQAPHWDWLAERLGKRGGEPQVLNLFGYTGMATLVAATAGARVTHIDASKPAMSWARHNQELSGLSACPVRWILDDAFKFVGREVKRQRQYTAILLDPPSFGRGPKGEIWKVEAQIVDLLKNLRRILVSSGGMLLLTMYNLEASSLMLANLVSDVFGPGELSFGELGLREAATDRVLPLSLFCRWEGK